MSNAAALFEQELTRRGIAFRLNGLSDRYVIDHAGTELFISLHNVNREYARDQDASCIMRFADSVLSPRIEKNSWDEARTSVLFCFEPSDYAKLPELRHPISDRVDRVPVNFDPGHGLISWITSDMLGRWQITLKELELEAVKNLDAALNNAIVQHKDIDGVRLGYLETTLPFKTALLLAPNLKEVVAPLLGWPLHAVMPDRDFLFLWDSRHTDFVSRIGRLVVDEFTQAPYPISTEVFEVSDSGIKPIGAFAEPSEQIS
jgi:hypothetical protein